MEANSHVSHMYLVAERRLSLSPSVVSAGGDQQQATDLCVFLTVEVTFRVPARSRVTLNIDVPSEVILHMHLFEARRYVEVI